jgi:hypothetical protein
MDEDGTAAGNLTRAKALNAVIANQFLKHKLFVKAHVLSMMPLPGLES